MDRTGLLCTTLLLSVIPALGHAEEATYRLYDELTAFVDNPTGGDFTVTLELRDINHIARGPSELLVKVYAPDGRPVVREVIPDDGVTANTGGPCLPGWDHEAWYYATCYSRGLEPMVRWSAFSDPARLAAMAERTFRYVVHGEQRGTYRIVLAGSPDLYVTLKLDPPLRYGVSGGPDWTHGHGKLYERAFVYVPRGAQGISVRLLELDMPARRTCTVEAPDGSVLATCDAGEGMAQASFTFEPAGKFDDTILRFEVSDGPGDYFVDVRLLMPKEQRNWRGQPRLTAVLCPDEATAKAVRNGAIYHDGQVFWQMYQVRLYDWLKTLKPEDFAVPKDLPKNPRAFISVGSHQSPVAFLKKPDLHDPRPGAADLIMHDYVAHRNRQALNVALQEMLEGLRLIGPNDHVIHGGNLAYEMGTYSYFYHRPAWRILQQSDAPEEAKAPIREFIIQIGDRLAFCRGIELINGNALASLVQALRYCYEATGDPLQKELFETYWDRFTTGGFDERIGVGPSGGVQEGFGYDHHYGSYIISGWQAVLADLGDERFRKVLDGVLNLYSYTASQGLDANPWSSRTHLRPTRYDPAMEGPYRWKGFGGPDFTVSVNNANEFFAARRSNYYAVTYHGRITPTWLGEGFHGQIGFSGGILCQLHIPGQGQVLASTLSGSYGAGMHLSNWRNFHIHSIVGQTADGQPLVTANSEHFDARLVDDTVTSSGEVRQSSVHVTRSYTFGASDILCSVKLRQSTAEKLFGIYGGPHGLRGMVTEAYEMIPFTKASVPGGKGKPPIVRTSLTRLGVDGASLGPVMPQPAPAAAVLIDQDGYGVRIDLDEPRPVLLGNRDTVLIQLAGPSIVAEGPADDAAVKPVPADSIALSYRLRPYVGEPPAEAITTQTAPAEAAGVPAAGAHKLAVLHAIDVPGEVAGALAGQPIHTVRSVNKVLAELRLAIAGDKLALDARVFDRKPEQAEVAWKGSCIEVFGSPPGGARIGQVLLVPQVGDAPAKAYQAQQGELDPAPQIGLRSMSNTEGYQLQALIPLSLLALDSAMETLQLEFQVTTMAQAENKVERATLFGSSLAYINNSRYGLFRLEKQVEERRE